MPYVPFSFPLTGGIDRNVTSLRADKASFYTLENLRQSNTVRGVIEQTPRFYAGPVHPVGSYWTGFSVETEPTVSRLRFFDETLFLSVSDYTIYAGHHLPIFRQVSQPIGESANTGCLFTVEDTSQLSIAIGQSYEVEIDSPTTFQWRVGGGAWVTGITIDPVDGNVIDNGVRLFWMTGTGFTIGHKWAWLRTDNTALAGDSSPYPPRFVQVNEFVYFISQGRPYVIDTAVGYARTVGYRAILANAINVYENHLFLFGPGPMIKVSDLENFDLFIATDVNEADIFHFPLIRPAGGSASLEVFDGAVSQGRLFVTTSSGLYYTDYAGLPVPFSFKKIVNNDLDEGSKCFIIDTRAGMFVVSPNDLFQFDGTGLRKIFNFLPIIGNTGEVARNVLFNNYTSELIINFGDYLLVYQTNYGTLYKRYIGFTGGCTALSIGSTGYLNLGTTNRTACLEDHDFSQTPIHDYLEGFAVPTLVTQLLDSGSMQKVKELNTAFIGALYANALENINYAASSEVKLVISWRVSPNGAMPDTASTHAEAFWAPDTTEDISWPRVDYRAVALQLTLTSTDVARPPALFQLFSLETQIYVSQADR